MSCNAAASACTMSGTTLLLLLVLLLHLQLVHLPAAGVDA
jgi:hypothetical protein